MRAFAKLAAVIGLLAASLGSYAWAEKQTVCTITVNSADEKETFRRFLPASKYQFVELVERGRPDWLASACQAAVSCDVLVISGHYGGGNVFFSDALDVSEFLPMAELERVSCSDSCRGLFSKLKEVHLFGCNTLNPQPQNTASAELVRSLIREGRSRADAERAAKSLSSRHSGSNRDLMRMVFKDVPVIYGFSSTAPLGPVAAPMLSRYLGAGGIAEVGNGRASSRLLSSFSSHGLTVTRGMTGTDPRAGVRQDMCQFADDRLSDAQRLRFVHQLLQRQTPEARMFLDRIERYAAALDEKARRGPEAAQALEDIGRDADARRRYLDFARDADEPETRARMINVSHALGWLSPGDRRSELVRLFGELLAGTTIAPTQVDLACTLNKKGELDGTLEGVPSPAGRADSLGHAAIRACMGSAEGHARTLQALASPADADVRIAQTYLRHRPIDDVAELRMVAAAIARMNESEAQVRALDTLGQHYLSDPETLQVVTRLFSQSRSPAVQNAIAGLLIRADRKSLALSDLTRILREHRRSSVAGTTMVDALISRLQLP